MTTQSPVIGREGPAPAMMARDKATPWIQAASGNASVRLITLATGVILARTLGPSGRGLITIAMLWPGLMMSFGTVVNTQTCTYFGARAGEAGIRACLRAAVWNGGALFVGALLLNWLILRRTQPELVAAANTYALVVPVTVLAAVCYGALLSGGQIGAYWASRIVAVGSTIIGVLILAASRRLSIDAYIWCVVGGLALALGFAMRSRRMRDAAVESKAPSMRAIAAYGSQIVLGMLPSQVNYRIDQLLLALLLAPEVVGQYVVAVTWSSSVSVIGTGFGSVVLSQSSRIPVDDRQAIATTLANIRRASILLLIVALTGIATAAFGLPLVFGDRFAAAVAPAMLLCVATFVLNTKLLYQDFARGLGSPALPLAPEAVGAMLRVPLLLVLLPAMSARGAAVASIVSYAVVLVLLCVRLARQVPAVRRSDFVPRLSDVASIGRLVSQTSRAVISQGLRRSGR